MQGILVKLTDSFVVSCVDKQMDQTDRARTFDKVMLARRRLTDNTEQVSPQTILSRRVRAIPDEIAQSHPIAF